MLLVGCCAVRLRQIQSMALILGMFLYGAVLADEWESTAESIVIYTYHDKPPYFFRNPTTGELQGVYADLINMVNDRLSSPILELEYLPRRRLNLMLENNRLIGGVVGVNPLWFDDINQRRYVWSRSFMVDEDVIVIRDDSSIGYQQPDDLAGLHIALVEGLYYWGVTELIEDSLVRASITATELQNLQMVARQRVDASIVGMLTFEHYDANEVFDVKLRYLSTPHDRFERSIFLTGMERPQATGLMRAIDDVISDSTWQSRVAEYTRHTQR